ncbi:hypothetical protein GCM10010116_39640 [Microbispora rosea subsp. aerata]|nr:hypothetical protein GCM10010116_39640 [Microbispora rosea subsp. aerata]GIH57009.1 hypothetical protein Mro02_39230 [Microbispora rosea subsp. aerata]
MPTTPVSGPDRAIDETALTKVTVAEAALQRTVGLPFQTTSCLITPALRVRPYGTVTPESGVSSAVRGW